MSIRQYNLVFARSKLELASDVIIWQPTHGKRNRGRPRRTYFHQHLDDILCDLNEIKKAMEDRYGWRKIVKTTRYGNVSNIYIYTYIYIYVFCYHELNKQYIKTQYIFFTICIVLSGAHHSYL